MKALKERSSHKNSNRKEAKSVSIIFVLACQYRSHSVLLLNAIHCPNCFCPWVRGGCIACSRLRGGFQCGEDVYPDNHVHRTTEILLLPFFLSILLFWLFLASKVVACYFQYFTWTYSSTVRSFVIWGRLLYKRNEEVFFLNLIQ